MEGRIPLEGVFLIISPLTSYLLFHFCPLRVHIEMAHNLLICHFLLISFDSSNLAAT